MFRVGLGTSLLVALAGVWAGCSGTDNAGIAGTGAVGAGSGNAGAGAGGTAASSGNAGASGGGAVGGFGGGANSGGIGAGGPTDSGIPDVAFTYDGNLPEEDACAAVTVTAQLVPLDLYVVLDRSGSMVNPSLGNLRWPPVRNALNQFFQSAQAKNIGIALTMFAHPSKSQCSASSYQTPMVAMAPLPGNASGHALTLQNTMNANAPALGIGTPTESAMQGAVTFARNHKNANAGRTVAIILATDGIPGAACSGQSASGVQSAIAGGFTGNPSIKTFVIGIDPNSSMKTNITNWANAGGGQSFDVATSAGSAQFLQAMKNIQGSLLGCTFSMPKPSTGVVQPDKVKVIFTPGSGGPIQLPRATNKAACSGPGWFYDNNTTPTTIELCPASCTTAQGDPNGKIDIELGCLGS